MIGFRYRQRRPDESEGVYAERQAKAEAAYEQRERELDEWDALMFEAHTVTYEPGILAMRLAGGSATLTEVQEFLAVAASSGNAYVDLSSLQMWCVQFGLDPATGFPVAA